MARRRMISKDVWDEPDFNSMTKTAQVLYVNLVLNADDEGFVINPDEIKKSKKCTDNAMQELIDNGYIIMFDSGKAVVRHWYMMNRVDKDKFKETKCQDDKSLLLLNGDVYELDPDAENASTEGDEEDASASADGKVRENRPSVKNVVKDQYTQRFELLWNHYPRKNDKQKAFIAFKNALNEGVPFETIYYGFERYNQFVKNRHIDEKDVIYGVTFINQKKWEDDFEEARAAKDSREAADIPPANDKAEGISDYLL